MKIVFNGDETEIERDTTLAELLASAGLLGKRIAIEVNREIVPRSEYATRSLAPADRIEVVQAIGGG
ncbi:MAG: sulfur carrier protein ThiS [Rhodanobacteraceae bacterium]